jgi:nitric oxide reductase NorQ protein
LCTRKFRGKFPVINNLGHGEAAPARNSRPSRFPGGIPDDRPAIPAPAAKGRLGNGQLRRQVAEWLAARPGPHTVGEIARDLGRSAGAVGNALTTLADRAEASRLAGKPIRYQANSATAAAAAAITSKAPAPPKTAPAAPKPAASPAPPKPAAPPAQPAQPAAPKTPAPSAKPGPVTRPGRQVYRPHVLAGMADVEALRTLRAEGGPSLLDGPPGSGKTSLVEAAFPDLITVAGDGDTTVGDFVGEYTQQPDGTYEFIYGPLIRAMQKGRPGAVHRRRDPHLAGGAGGLLTGDGRPPRAR